MFHNDHNIFPIESEIEVGKYPVARIMASTKLFDKNVKKEEWVRVDLYNEDEPTDEMFETYMIVTQEDGKRELFDECGPAKFCLEGIAAYLGSFLENRAEYCARARSMNESESMS